jgi:hypothetical protein
MLPVPIQTPPVLPQFALIRPVVEQQELRQITRVAVQPARESRDTEAQRERNDRSEQVSTGNTGPVRRNTAGRGHRGLNLDINV